MKKSQRCQSPLSLFLLLRPRHDEQTALKMFAGTNLCNVARSDGSVSGIPAVISKSSNRPLDRKKDSTGNACCL